MDDIKKTNEELKLKVKRLEEEIDSLWAMMDELTQTDVQNLSQIARDLDGDVITKTLMITNKKADA